MLKTNSRAARENIRAYIMNGYDGTGYDNAPESNDFDEIAHFIYDTFKAEKYYTDSYCMKYRISEHEITISMVQPTHWIRRICQHKIRCKWHIIP